MNLIHCDKGVDYGHGVKQSTSMFKKERQKDKLLCKYSLDQILLLHGSL